MAITAEGRERIGQAHRGKPSHRRRRVHCEEMDQTWDSASQCAEALKLNISNITKVCRGELLSCNGFHFRYVDLE